MCTVTWLHQDSGYSLFSNRDEKLTRPRCTPPLVHERKGVRFIAPVDTAFGGTWIACNEFGVSMTLLNGAAGIRKSRSRGLLVMELADVSSQTEAVVRLRSIDLTAFAALTLVVLEPGRPAMVCAWNGRALSVTQDAEACLPLASSSFDFEGVRKARREQLAAIGDLDVRRLRCFHGGHAPRPEPIRRACIDRMRKQ